MYAICSFSSFSSSVSVAWMWDRDVSVFPQGEVGLFSGFCHDSFSVFLAMTDTVISLPPKIMYNANQLGVCDYPYQTRVCDMVK